ncbi:MAG: hypothetical protein GX146_04005 [Myxococcales bacterium]|jgi:hypothetical protein|nr:hypothetical protein [Myxococcales bacterium]
MTDANEQAPAPDAPGASPGSLETAPDAPGASPDALAASRPRPAPYLIAAWVLILAAMSLLFANRFVWDDRLFFSEHNVAAHRSLSALPTMLTVPFWDNSMALETEVKAYWRPLTTAVLWAAGFIAGSATWIYRLFSIAAAMGAALALARLVRTVYPRAAEQRLDLWIGLLYVAHPVTSEVYCMAANISDHLGFGFMLLALADAVQRARGDVRGSRLARIALFALLSALSKEFGVLCAAIPLLAVILAGAPRKRLGDIPLWLATWVPVALYLVGRYFVASGTPSSGLLLFIPWQWALAAGDAVRQLVVFPVRATHRALDTSSALQWGISALVLGGYLGAVVTAAVRRNANLARSLVAILAGFGLLWLSLGGSTYPAMFTQFPVRFIHLFWAALLLGLAPWFIAHARVFTPRLLLVLVLAFSVSSALRVAHWRTEVTFFQNEYEAHPDLVLNWKNLLLAYMTADRSDDALQLIDARLQRKGQLNHEEEVARIIVLSYIAFDTEKNSLLATRIAHEGLIRYPRSFPLLMNLVKIRGRAGHPEEGVDLLRRALQNPKNYSRSQVREMEQNIRDYEAHQRRQAEAPADAEAAPAPKDTP